MACDTIKNNTKTIFAQTILKETMLFRVILQGRNLQSTKNNEKS